MEDIYVKTDVFASWVVEKYFKDKDIVTLEEILCDFEDVAGQLEHTEEQFEDYKQYVEDNFKPMTIEEQIGYNENC
jgi:hypothetical protein